MRLRRPGQVTAPAALFSLICVHLIDLCGSSIIEREDSLLLNEKEEVVARRSRRLTQMKNELI
jgi:hypothetical protein